MPDADPVSAQRTQLSLVDVKRAYFNAKVDQNDPPVFVVLPAEDPDSKHLCARLLRHVYGTRLAADGGHDEYSMLLVGFGFEQGASCPNLFYHKGKSFRCSVHGDDFTVGP